MKVEEIIKGRENLSEMLHISEQANRELTKRVAQLERENKKIQEEREDYNSIRIELLNKNYDLELEKKKMEQKMDKYEQENKLKGEMIEDGK